MTLSPSDLQRFTDNLIRYEGTKRDAGGLHIAYRCTAGALTIGYGHNLDANPVPGIYSTTRLSEDQARRLLAVDIAAVEAQVQKALPWAPALGPVRYCVLLDMAFNMGISGLLSFKNTLAMVKSGDYAGAAKNMLLSKWATQVHFRATDNAKRMETGVW